MGLNAKFNAVMAFTSLVGLVAAGWLAWVLLQQNAREEVLHYAGVMMEGAMAIRGYTVSEIKPLLDDKMQHEFLPQTVPAYAATQNIQRLRQRYPDYSYKEATLNPTNPTNRATDWEADIVDYFRNHPESQELIGERTAATGRMLYMARPIQIKAEGCLTCHDTADRAPTTLIARYGPANGFGWKLNEVVGAQVVAVPMSVAFDRAARAWWTFMLGLIGVFLLVALVLNLLVHFIVVRPVNRMARIADRVSLGDESAPEVPVRGRDQIASLASSFNRMRRSLGSAMEMLEDSLQEPPAQPDAYPPTVRIDTRR